MSWTPTRRQRAELHRVIVGTEAGTWVRALSAGDRVTLASLYRAGFLDRRAWRGAEGHPDAAYEYQATKLVMDAWRAGVPA